MLENSLWKWFRVRFSCSQIQKKGSEPGVLSGVQSPPANQARSVTGHCPEKGDILYVLICLCLGQDHQLY